MPRLPRYVLPGHPQHIIQRGNNRQITFVTDEDYGCYLEWLGDACQKYNVDVHAYVLMTNHVHLLMTPHTKDGLSRVMQTLGRRYVQYFNHTYRRTGTLWEGRYKATLIDTENYLLTCYRYLELNPVRANMVKRPDDYRWSSYHTNALGKNNRLITPHSLYLQLANGLDTRLSRYKDLFKVHLDESTLIKIRETTNKAWVLGTTSFQAQISEHINRRTEPLRMGGDRRSKEFELKR